MAASRGPLIGPLLIMRPGLRVCALSADAAYGSGPELQELLTDGQRVSSAPLNILVGEMATC